MIALSMTLSDPILQFQGHPTVRKQICHKHDVVRVSCFVCCELHAATQRVVKNLNRVTPYLTANRVTTYLKSVKLQMLKYGNGCGKC